MTGVKRILGTDVQPGTGKFLLLQKRNLQVKGWAWTIIGLALGALSFCGSSTPAGKLVKGKWAYQPASYKAGAYRLQWKGDALASARLTIYHEDDRQRPLWSSLPGMAFVGAARGQISEYIPDSFSIEDKIIEHCKDQSIDRIVSGYNALFLRGELLCAQEKLSYRLNFRQTKEKHLRLHFFLPKKHRNTKSKKEWNRSYLIYSSTPDENFYGFGMQFSSFNMNGRRLPVFIREQGLGRGAQPITVLNRLLGGISGDWHTSPAVVPHYITSNMRSLCLENHEYSIFDMRPADKVEIQVFNSQLKARLIPGTTPLELIENYSKFTGRMRPLPDWILKGAVVGIHGGSQKIYSLHQRLVSLGTPVSAYLLSDWIKQKAGPDGRQLGWNGDRNDSLYPKWKKLVSDLKAQNVFVMAYLNPLFTHKNEEGRQRSLFEWAKKRGYFIRDEQERLHLIRDGSVSAALLDLSHPGARRWIKSMIKRQLLGSGFSGWMADLGEGLPYDARLYRGAASVWHNRYAEEWARLNRQAIREAGRGNSIVFFSRSAFLRSPAYSSLFWLGKQLVSWDEHDGIKTVVPGLLSGGISGFSMNHSDIGGHTSSSYFLINYHRSKELLQRWIELAAFTPVFRTHEGSRPKDNEQIYSDDENMAFFARFAKVYRALYAYRKKLVTEAAQRGRPMLRHLFLHYPKDPEVQKLSHQEFLLGSEILVAPVLDAGKEEVNVYFPAGDWIHLWSGKTYSSRGEWQKVPAPLGQPAVFFKKGSIDGEGFRRDLVSIGLL